MDSILSTQDAIHRAGWLIPGHQLAPPYGGSISEVEAAPGISFPLPAIPGRFSRSLRQPDAQVLRYAVPRRVNLLLQHRETVRWQLPGG